MLIGGQNVKAYSLHDVRDNISIVSQETILFRDSIRNNIRLGRLDATDEEVEEYTRKLMDRMKKAVIEDCESNEKKMPAL